METRPGQFSKGEIRGTPDLIFVTVGTCDKSFDRLIKAVDDLAARLSEEVVIQIGISKYLPQNATYFGFCPPHEMESLIDRADLIIAHAGFGNIGQCISKQKRIILVPREKRFDDAIDNQVELAEYLAERSRGIICLRDVAKLSEAFIEIKNITPCYQFTNHIPELVHDFLNRKFLYNR